MRYLMMIAVLVWSEGVWGGENPKKKEFDAWMTRRVISYAAEQAAECTALYKALQEDSDAGESNYVETIKSANQLFLFPTMMMAKLVTDDIRVWSRKTIEPKVAHWRNIIANRDQRAIDLQEEVCATSLPLIDEINNRFQQLNAK